MTCVLVGYGLGAYWGTDQPLRSCAHIWGHLEHEQERGHREMLRVHDTVHPARTRFARTENRSDGIN